MTEEIIIDVLY